MKDQTTLDGGEELGRRLDVVHADRYVVGALLGEGGMGEVREATDRRTGREVALKVALGTGLSARFVREARVQAQLEHPGVVPVFDIGRTNDDRPFFTMKRAYGITLDQALERARAGDPAFSQRRLLAAFLRICLTVAYAHARGVLHRDLKPSNVMLGDYREVYVLDWGIAKPGGAVDEPATGDEKPGDRTATGATMGTPAYMAPERSTGAPADERSDVFALGSILFEILANEPLYGRVQVQAAMSHASISYDARPSSRRSGVAAELEAICLRATAPSPDDRHASARELHDAVAAYLDADRDTLDRRRLAAEHCERAAAALAAGREEQALSQLGQALALDARAPEARRLFVEVMAQRRKPPPAVLAEVDNQRLARLVEMTPNTVASYTLQWITLYPLIVFSAGVRSIAGALVPVAAWCLAAAVVYVVNRRRIFPRRFSFSAVATMLAVALTTVTAGPFFMVPQLIAVIVMGFMLVDPRSHRPAVITCALLALLVPTWLAWSGVHDVYSFHDQELHVHGAVRTPPYVWYIGFTASEILVVAFAWLYVSHYRRLLDEANVRNALVAWQLEAVIGEGPRRDPARAPFAPPASNEPPIESGNPDPTGPRYLRFEEIAPGVHRGRDQQLARDVRIAVYDPSHWERASREACLVHPAIPPIYDVGLDEDGKLFTVSRIARGTALDVVLAGERPPNLLLAFVEACLAIELAHESGAVHGALSPTCIELGAYGEIDVLGFTWNGTKEDDVAGLGRILRAIVGGGAAPELEAVAARAESGEIASARTLANEVEAFLAGRRDEDLRKRLAKSHLAHAEAAAERALVDPAARVEAVREAGRAHALGEKAGGELLLRLLTTPPEKPPAQVVARVQATRESRARATLYIAVAFAAMWFTVYPLAAWVMGVRDVKAAAVVVVGWLFAEAAVLAEIRFGSKLSALGTIAMMAACATTSALVGPFFLVGIFVTVVTMSRTVIVPARVRPVVLVAAIAAIVVPTILAWTGIHRVYLLEGDAIVQHGAFDVSRTSGFVGLTSAHLLVIIFAAGYTARFRDTLDAVEAKNMYFAWKVTRLLRR